MQNPVRLTLDGAQGLVRDLLLAHGFSPGHTEAIAETVTTAERGACLSHGLLRVPGYVDGVVAGVVDRAPIP